MASAAKSARPALQLIALTADKVNFHYAELHDDHILRGSSRRLYASNVKILEMSAEWKAYLGDRNVEIEQPASKWIKVKLEAKRMKYMLRHDSGYVMPLLIIKNAAFCEYFPRMAAAAPAAMPAQTVRPPGIVAAGAAPRRASRTVVISLRRDDDADSAAEAVCNGDDDPEADDGKKERDALRAAVESMMRPKSKSKASSAPKVSFK